MTQDIKKDTILQNIVKRLIRNGCTPVRLGAYSSSLRGALKTMLLLVMMILGFETTWGQGYSGTYFIASGGEARAVNNKNTVEDYSYGEDTPATNYYLVPASDPAQANWNDAYFDGTTGEKPFLTTYKTNLANEAIWVVTQVTDDDGTFYHIKHAETGKYVIFEKFFSNDNWRRKCLHLDGTTASEAGKFIISYDATNKYYNIKPKNPINKNGDVETSFIFCNVSDKNRGSRHGVDASTYYGGLIGLWSSGTEANSKWKFEKALCATPTISFDNATNEVTISTSTDGATIYYTMGDDPADPTTAADGHDGTGTTSVTFSISGPTKIKAIAVKQYWVASAVSPTKVISQVAQPVIEDNGAQAISITCETEGATIYYTTDGTTPPSRSSLVYSTPLTDVSNKTIRAIAVKDQYLDSEEGSGTIKLKCAKPVITKVGNTFTISCPYPGDANIFYTTGAGEPTTPYSGAVSFTDSDLPFTVKAIAKKSNDYNDSDISSKYFGVNLTGGGTSDNPFLIKNVDDFEVFVDMLNDESEKRDKYYKIEKTNSNNGLINIGDCSAFFNDVVFSGTLDGDFVTLSGLDHPLFNTISGGIVKNVVLDNIGVSSTVTFKVGDDDKTAIGAIAGVATGTTRIYNCGILATNSTVKTNNDGYTEITSCSSSVGGTADYVGGFVGFLDGEARVINCYSYANITGGTEVGGIVGHNNVATASNNLKTMVMNCMYYGDITRGSDKAPIYNGTNIVNKDADGVGNYNYFYSEASYAEKLDIQTPNSALMAEGRFLQRFEFFRYLLNSHRELAGWWATGIFSKNDMAKWVLEPSQIGTSTPYPILKTAGYYPSVVNIDAENATTQSERNKGGKLGTLTVNIQMGSGGAVFGPPTGAKIETDQLTLNITDKDPDHFNFNYYKVQLPYYNDVGTKNYNGNRVVTGWKIVSITGGTEGSFTTGDDATASVNAETGKVTLTTPYNFADRHCTNKDLYGTGGSNRVFSQGAYWDVPENVTAITIEPYWAKAAYVADAYADVVYNTGMGTKYDVPYVGGGQIYSNNTNYNIAGEEQKVFTTINDAVTNANGLNKPTGNTVNDYAVVLVGNVHQYTGNNAKIGESYKYTVTAIDLDGDNEPDYSLMLRDDGRNEIHPLKWDFLNLVGLGMAQKSTGGTGSYNLGILCPRGWFETTNTALLRVTQLEFEFSGKVDPLILQGGVMEQWVSSNQKGTSDAIPYYHVGGNVWFKEFHLGCHQDKQIKTKHSPVSVTGGDYGEFYLTGLYRGDVGSKEDNAECYINGGRFGIVCGAAMEGIGKSGGTDNTGNITWQIQNADIKEFYAGGITAAAGHIVEGNLTTVIEGGYIKQFCGGPKFGDMNTGKSVVTNATGCTFDKFFGAGYGGNSYSRQAPRNHNHIVNFPHNDAEGAGNYDTWNAWVTDKYTQSYNATYGGVSTQFNYQFLPMSSNTDNVARLFVEYVKFSLAKTHGVTSTLKGCTINENFYGGGSLGKVEGDVTSTLTNCTVKGNVFGAGFSAQLPTVTVDGIGGFEIEPYYYTDYGTYRTGVKYVDDPDYVHQVDVTNFKPQTYNWQHASTVNSTATAIKTSETEHILYTTENLEKSNLGSVQGNVTLTIQTEAGKTTTIGTADNSDTGNVFGGGEESYVINTPGNPVTVNTVTVNIKGPGTTNILGNVFGGGDEGLVEGSTTVNIE